MHRSITWSVALAIALTLGRPADQASAQEPLTLERALAQARANSQQLRSALATAQLAAEDRVQARAALLPSITGFGQYIYTEPNGTPSGVFVANDGPKVYNAWGTAHGDLFAPGKWADYRSAAANEALAKARTDMASRGLVQTVVQDYYSVVSSSRRLASVRQSLAEAEQFLRVTQQQEQGGEAAHSDVVKAQIQVAQRQRDAREAELAALKNRLALSVLVYPDFRDTFAVADDLDQIAPLPSLDEVKARAAGYSPDVKAAEAAVQAQVSGVSSARSARLPSVSFDYWYGIDANQVALYNPAHQRLLGSVAAAQMSIPLWNWGATQSRLRQAELRVQQARADLTLAERQLLANISTDYAEADTARAQLDSLRNSLALAAESLQLTVLRYQAGEVSVLEVVDAQTTLMDARNAHDDGLVRYRVALAALQTLTGTL